MSASPETHDNVLHYDVKMATVSQDLRKFSAFIILWNHHLYTASTVD